MTETNAKRQRDIARKLEQLPHLGNAALRGDLSPERLAPAAELADEDSDAEITATAKHTSPLDLQKMARAERAKPRREDSAARRNRRSLRKWRSDDGVLCGRFELPMEHGGAIVEGLFDLVTERMKPPTGDITLDGEATVCGVPLRDEWVHAARADARVHLRVVDDDGTVIAEDRARTFVSQKRRRAAVRRDGRCRWPGCNRRLRLQGRQPNQPDGLTLRLVTAEERRQRRLEPMTLAA